MAFLTLAVILAAPATLRAAPDLLLGSGLGTPGSTVLLPLGHVADPEVVAFQVDVVHDGAVLAVNAVNPGPALAGSDHEVAWNLLAPGRLRIVVLSRTNAQLPGGAVATLSLQVAETAPLGPQALSVEAAELVSSLAAVVPPTVLAGGEVSVVACLAGDVHPAGVGDSALTLADLVQSLRDLRAGTASGGRYATCAELAGGSVSCAAAAPESWCPAGDGGSFSLDDALVLRRLATRTARLSCAACDSLPEPGAAPVPGDLALPQGVVDVSDVLRILRVAVGLDAVSPADLLAADVAPADPVVEGVRTVRGDGTVDVQDVLIVLRAAVGLERVDWQLRTLVLSLTEPASFVAFSATVTGLPSSAAAATLQDADCSDAEASGADSSVGTWSLTCVSDPTLRSDVSGAIASFGYRAPMAVDPGSLSLSSELVDASLSSTTGVLTMAAGTP
jgi:hypothetical protein